MHGSDGGTTIRRARPGEALDLSELAMRSKAHWGYDAAFMQSMRQMLTFSERELSDDHVYVLDDASGPAGMYRVIGAPPEGELADLWVDPRAIGRGSGRAMLTHAREIAASLGFASLLIESDPNAEGFYLAMGAVRAGERRSASGRTLPLLRLDCLDERVRYLEDLSVGERFELGSVVAEREDMIAFARRFDPQPFHIDEAAAAATAFGGIIASGWHTGAMFSRLCVDGFMNHVANLGGLGFDATRFLAPVRPGDILHATLEIVEARASERRPDRGTLTVLGTLHDEQGATVFTTRVSVRVARRPSGAPAQPR